VDHNAGLVLPDDLDLIPAELHTAADVDRAKRTGLLPARALVDADVPEIPADHEDTVEPGAGNIGADVPAEPALNSTAADVSDGMAVEEQVADDFVESEEDIRAAPIPHINYADKYSYDYWPQLPWSPDPSLDDLSTTEMRKKENAQAWLRTKPLMGAEDESRWHGVRFLGARTYGGTGLWVKVDVDGSIEDVGIQVDRVSHIYWLECPGNGHQGSQDWRCSRLARSQELARLRTEGNSSPSDSGSEKRG
jgi:hypothetical protein